jgi:protein gp37
MIIKQKTLPERAGIMGTELVENKTWSPLMFTEISSRKYQFCGFKYKEIQYDVSLDLAILEKPLKWDYPCRIFIHDMFRQWVGGSQSHEHIRRVMDVITQTPHHIYLLATTRPRKMQIYFDEYSVPDNVFLGANIRWREATNDLLTTLFDIEAEKYFILMEPLMNEIDLTQWLVKRDEYYLAKCPKCRWVGSSEHCGSGIEQDGCQCPRCYEECGNFDGYDPAPHFVMVSYATAPKRPPLNCGWVLSIHNQCKRCDVPFVIGIMDM